MNGDVESGDAVPTVRVETVERVRLVTIERPEVRNAVDEATARALDAAFAEFDADETVDVAILSGAGGSFCSGADLKKISAGAGNAVSALPPGRGPMGPTHRTLSKPVIAAVEGPAVAGGMELALWCDLRVVAEDAYFGVYCRRWGVPLIDGGTVRLPRLVGHSVAMDLILTGRQLPAEEAVRIGLAHYLTASGGARERALELARALCRFPQACLRSDRRSALEQWSLSEEEALANELVRGRAVIASGETAAGASRFAGGSGRSGSFDG